jgi:hypothetical protein
MVKASAPCGNGIETVGRSGNDSNAAPAIIPNQDIQVKP